MVENPAQNLRNILEDPGLLIMPCCFDALSAKLIEANDFALTFMSGFGVSASRLALPDTGLISFGEMCDQGRNICGSVSIPVIGDADTGYGNALNVKRTVREYARAGFAGIMLEDQISPKRCGHTRGKQVVDRREAVHRIRAAVDAREENADLVIIARTDARVTHDLDEAIARAHAFADAGADIIFVEAPQSEKEMERIAREITQNPMANMLEQGLTPILPPKRLEEMGFKIVAYPLTLLTAACNAMNLALQHLEKGTHFSGLMPFEQLKDLIGFNDYYRDEEKYSDNI
mgnify:CR=1 FL=1